MDPITSAARSFLEQSDAFWRAHPTSVLRLVVAPEHRADLIKALRLAEMQPENRCPLFLVETPFTKAAAYSAAVCKAIFDDYEAIRRGAQEEGVVLPPLAESPACPELSPWAQIAVALVKVEVGLGDGLEGGLLVLLPEHIESADEWTSGVASLARAPRSVRARTAVLDLPGERLASLLGKPRVKFEVDEAALGAFIAAVDEDLTGRPAAEGPSAALAAGDGPVPRLEVPRTLRRELLAAADALRAGQPDTAIGLLERLREACVRAGYADGELAATLALGGAHTASGDHEKAASAYRSAVGLCAKGAFPTLECQAMLGEAASLFAAGDPRSAAETYASTTVRARSVGVTPLAEQAERMERACRAAMPAGAPSPRKMPREAQGATAEGAIATKAPSHADLTHEIQPGDASRTLPFVAKEIDPMSLGPSAGTRGPSGFDTGTVQLLAVNVSGVLPFQGPRVEAAKASFMLPTGADDSALTEVTAEVEVARAVRPATPFETAKRKPS